MFVAAPRRKPVSLWVSARTEANNMAIPGFGEIAEQLRRSTVLIHSGGRGAGSGVIWSDDGLVVTHAHVGRARTCSCGTAANSRPPSIRAIRAAILRNFASTRQIYRLRPPPIPPK